MTIPPTATIERNEAIIFTDLDDTVVMMDPDEGAYYELDPIGTRIWTLLEAPRPMAELCETLTEEYDVDPDTCRSDVTAFLEETRDLGIIAVRGGAQ